jgi:hypothetical protein
MSDALLYQGNAPARLKYWLQRHLSGSATLMMEAGIASTLRFMREKADGFESLLMGKHEIAGQSGKMRPDFGWYAVQWRGSQVEVILSPHRGGRPGSAEIVCEGLTLAYLKEIFVSAAPTSE